MLPQKLQPAGMAAGKEEAQSPTKDCREAQRICSSGSRHNELLGFLMVLAGSPGPNESSSTKQLVGEDSISVSLFG